jgi:hypothetical protein
MTRDRSVSEENGMRATSQAIPEETTAATAIATIVHRLREDPRLPIKLVHIASTRHPTLHCAIHVAAKL